MTTNDKPTGKRPSNLDLPFKKGPSDPGEWAYDHRVGLLSMVIVYLILGILFMSAKIIVGKEHIEEGFYVVLADEEPTVQPIPKIERSAEQSDDFSDVRNIVSNQNATNAEPLNSRLRDDRGTQVEQIYSEADAAQQRIKANRASYEEGLRQEQAIGRNTPASKENKNNSDAKIKGRVMVSYSLVNPLRQSVNLFVPAYQCEGGGQITVEITVNRNGKVISALPSSASSSVDDCITRTAVNAALNSRFNVEGNAPEKQQGTITYIFIPQ